ncbi:translation initiation factor IF-2 [Sulfurospirillum arcachonense]|uniref:translation initiation factor IF-2 n=1 Tax=Sulfurospirillum arcachonense TaxID=57666 RepID=UPI00046A7967|nr:translation initiation factor IF-2 [Sulfurospirillum arcachonense]
MTKVRIHEIAKELGIKSKEVVEKAMDLGLEVKAASSAVTEEQAEKLMNYVLTGVNENDKTANPKVEKIVEEPKKSEEKPKEESIKAVKTVEKKVDQTVKVETEPVKTSPKVEEPKVEVPVEEPKKESLATASVRKRRGLVIVKKKRPEKVVESPKDFPSPYAKKKNSQTLESVLGNSSEAVKKKKKVKKTPAEKKTSAEKIDIAFSDMADIKMDLEDNMVVLPDFSVKIEPKVEQRTKKNSDPSQIRTTKRPSFIQPQGIKRRGRKKRVKKQIDTDNVVVSSIEIPEEIRVYEFAEKIGKQVSEVIKELFLLGMMVTKNDFLDKDSIDILAETFEVEVTTIDAQEEFDYVGAYEESNDEDLIERAPIITIMGHVDHGKTSLLDYIRSSKVASGEAGGITQHVGAYMVEKNSRNITFIDTPGHAAFTEMRSRGAQVTDIVIVVVAANDGVMPQTIEAIEHARAAEVPFIIAMNKMDLEAANPDMAKAGLAEVNVTPVDWGGEYEFVEVSAKTGKGIDDLLEVILLQADLLELKANPNREAKATVIESSVEKGRGPVATIVINEGTLRVGDTIVAGTGYGKVRALLDDLGKPVKEAKPGEPVVVLGLSEVPGSGEHLVSVQNDKIAREYAQKRADYLRQKELSKSTKVTLDELSSKIAEGAIKNLPVILKADVQGSLEAIKGSLAKIKNDEVQINVISSGVGGITESDVALAEASENCVILGFHVRPTGSVKEKAKSSGVEIKTYNIIYDLIDDVTGLVSGLLSPVIREENIGQAQVREVFSVPKLGSIAGCIVTDGSINRGVKVRLIREGVIVYESTVSSLKRFKDDVNEVKKGYECGIGIDGFNDIKVGDFIESFKEVEEQAKLEV